MNLHGFDINYEATVIDQQLLGTIIVEFNNKPSFSALANHATGATADDEGGRAKHGPGKGKGKNSGGKYKKEYDTKYTD